MSHTSTPLRSKNAAAKEHSNGTRPVRANSETKRISNLPCSAPARSSTSASSFLALIGAGLCGVHQGLADRQLRHTVCHAGLVDKPYQFQPYRHVVCQSGGTFTGRGGRDGGLHSDSHTSCPAVRGGHSDRCCAGGLSVGCPMPQHIFHTHNIGITGNSSPALSSSFRTFPRMGHGLGQKKIAKVNTAKKI